MAVAVPEEVAQLGYQQLQMRKKIAMQMVMQQRARAAPKNVGEGLTSIGNAVGDAGMMRMLQQQEEEAQARRQQAQEEAARIAASAQPPGGV